MTSGHIGIRRVRQQGGDEQGGAREGRGVVGAVQDVVGEQGGDGRGVCRGSLAGGGVEESRERGVGGGQDGDVGQSRESADQGGLGAEEGWDGVNGWRREAESACTYM